MQNHELSASDRIVANVDARSARRLRRERLKPGPPTRSSKPVVGRGPTRAESGAHARAKRELRPSQLNLPTQLATPDWYCGICCAPCGGCTGDRVPSSLRRQSRTKRYRVKCSGVNYQLQMTQDEIPWNRGRPSYVVNKLAGGRLGPQFWKPAHSPRALIEGDHHFGSVLPGCGAQVDDRKQSYSSRNVGRALVPVLVQHRPPRNQPHRF